MAADIATLLGKSLYNRATIANSLCSVAEEEFQAGQKMRAIDTVRTLRGVLSEIAAILAGDVSCVLPSTMHEVATLLAGLDGRIAAIEAATGSQPPAELADEPKAE